MRRSQLVLNALCGLVLLAASRPDSAAWAQEKKETPKSGTVAGTVTDKNDKTITVRADGAEDPVAYDFSGSTDKEMLKTLKGIFSVGRVQLTYKLDGDTRRLVSIKKIVVRATGTVTGVVQRNNGWWIEVKPANGPSEGYAAHYPFDKAKDIMDKMKELEKGDTVTIRFVTDGERHRIETLQKTGKAKK
jgi:hypothetical protein